MSAGPFWSGRLNRLRKYSDASFGTDSAPPRSWVYGQLALLGQALASGSRLQILDLLGQGERPVESLARSTATTMANASQHLRVLRQAGLVVGRRQGQQVYYRLADGAVARFWLAFRELARGRMAELHQVLGSFVEGRDTLEPLGPEELMARVRAGEVAVLDVRPREEYQAGHILGALSLPLEDLEARLAELPHDREIVAYCRGPWCLMSLEAVDVLRRAGFRARRMAEGVLEWRSRGLEVVEES